MNKLFVSHEIAKQLKELGFNDPCIATYRLNDRIKLETAGSGINYDVFWNEATYTLEIQYILAIVVLHQL